MKEFFANLPKDEKYLAQSLKSHILLRDIARAIDLLEDVTKDEQLFRLYWFLCLSLLATAEDVLNKDVKQYPEMHETWKNRRNELNSMIKHYVRVGYSQCPNDFIYWCRLFHGERNNLIHEYIDGFSHDEDNLHLCASPNDIYDEDDFLNDKDLYRPMGNYDEFGDMDCRDFVTGGLQWWEHEISTLVHTFLCTESK